MPGSQAHRSEDARNRLARTATLQPPVETDLGDTKRPSDHRDREPRATPALDRLKVSRRQVAGAAGRSQMPTEAVVEPFLTPPRSAQSAFVRAHLSPGPGAVRRKGDGGDPHTAAESASSCSATSSRTRATTTAYWSAGNVR